MKPIYSKICVLALSGAIVTGCNDLDTELLGEHVTQEQKDQTIKEDPSSVKAGVTGIMANFINLWGIYGADVERHIDFGWPSVMLMLDSRGADMPGVAAGYNWYLTQMRMTDYNDNNYTNCMSWYTLYNQMHAANLVLESLDPKSDDPTYQFYMAQAHTMRAYDLFQLAQLFQFTYVSHQNEPCVPIRTVENMHDASGTPRATVEEVYKQIQADLKRAIELFEESGVQRSDKRYVDAAVAHGIRARVNLVMNHWEDAAQDAQDAIDLSGAHPYSIAQVSSPAFIDINDSSWLWGILINESDDVVSTGIVNFPSHMGSLCYGYSSVGAWRMINTSLYESIPDTDVRKGWWLNADGESTNAAATVYTCSPTLTASGFPAMLDAESYMGTMAGGRPYAQVKFAPYGGVLYQSTNACDIPLMRIEEMYYIKAEAMAMGGNPGGGKQELEDFVKAYRDPSYSCAASSAKDIQDEIWRQRRIEFWGEGISYFDLMRLNKGIDRRDGGFPSAYVFNVPAGDNLMRLLIPQGEMQANPKIGANNAQGSQPQRVQ